MGIDQTETVGRLRQLLSRALILLGLFILAYPFVSVARVQRQVLEEVPLPDNATVIAEDFTYGALFDSEFALASRDVNAPIEDVEQALLDNGFQVSGRVFTGNQFFSRECCGSYDAVVVSLLEADGDATRIQYTVSDHDLSLSWWFISGLGILVAVAGCKMSLQGASKRDSAAVTAPASNFAEHRSH